MYPFSGVLVAARQKKHGRGSLESFGGGEDYDEESKDVDVSDGNGHDADHPGAEAGKICTQGTQGEEDQWKDQQWQGSCFSDLKF